MKKLFYKWAFMDLDNSCEVKKTFFYEYADAVATTNLSMIKSLAVFITIIGFVVIGMALTFFKAPLLAFIYVLIIGVEIFNFVCASILLKKKRIMASHVLSSLFLLHMLLVSGVLATVYSPVESALVYVVVLIISQIVFVLPPLLTTLIGAVSLMNTILLSYSVKTSMYFKSDIINCVCVFILSILLGWRFTRIRIEQEKARNEAITLSEEMKQLSFVDQLTNLQNHRSFQDTYYKLFEELKISKEQLGIIMMDIDKFKQYNDGYGHLEGDHCLNIVGNCFKKLQNENIIAFRFGGEEFAVIVLGKECNRLGKIAENFRASIEKLSIKHEFSKVADVVTISVGYYLGKPDKISKPTQLIDYADQALYKSKEAGGNVVCGA